MNKDMAIKITGEYNTEYTLNVKLRIDRIDNTNDVTPVSNNELNMDLRILAKNMFEFDVIMLISRNFLFNKTFYTVFY